MLPKADIYYATQRKVEISARVDKPECSVFWVKAQSTAIRSATISNVRLAPKMRSKVNFL